MSKTRRKRDRTAAKQAVVPYARGYKQPTDKQRLSAVGNAAGRKEFSADDSFYSPIPAPTSIDDWLAQYNEEGQTYNQFVSQCPWLSKRKWKYSKATFNASGETICDKYPGAKIYLQPLENFDANEAPKFEDLAEYARLFFCLPVEVLPGVTLERRDEATIYWVESAGMKSRVDQNATRKSSRSSKCPLEFRHTSGPSGHLQLKCSSVLLRLRQTLPDDAICLIGLTMFDLYDDDPDLFVAGLAAGNQRVGVFSFFRYNPTLTFSAEFWYDVKRSEKMALAEQKRIILQRSCKLLVHEVCHLLGLDHCIWYSCLMNGSGHLGEDFSQPMTLCPVDLHKLQTLCDFDVTARYAGLRTFFQICGLDQEVDWIDRRLLFLSA